VGQYGKSCGGPCGYERFLDGIADPDVMEDEEILEWTDDEFDSEAFDLDAVNQKLAKVR
jgi:Plasmid pRiA4b ORF-3-like protein